MNRFTKILFSISVILFIVGIILSFLTHAYCTRSNNNYKEIQPESFVPDSIFSVFQDTSLKQLYVFYSKANCVNSYTEDGKFLWCVATPKMNYPRIELQDDKLFIYSKDAYIYDAKSGEFLEIQNIENVVFYDNSVETFDNEVKYYHDNSQVYKLFPNGDTETIVARPWWHILFSGYPTFIVSLIGAFGIGISIFYEKKKDYNAVKKAVTFKNHKAKIINNYFKITTIVHLIYACLNIICIFFTDWLIIGIIPITIHLIVSSIITWNTKDSLSCESDEMKSVDFWATAEIGSFIIAFLSIIIAPVIAGS